MTLILALDCADGLLLASDGQATVSTGGQPVKTETQKLYRPWSNIGVGILRLRPNLAARRTGFVEGSLPVQCLREEDGHPNPGRDRRDRCAGRSPGRH